jgi:hypothetical protein
MSLRKIAVLLAAGGLAVGLIGGGVGAQFTDSVKAIQNINVGTFSCVISDGGGGTISADQHSVTYDPYTIMSSTGSELLHFTVQNTGSIPDTLTVTSPAVTNPPFSIVGDPFAAVNLAPSATHLYNTGVQWTNLDNSWLGHSYPLTWTVNCGEQGGAAAGTVIFDNTPAGPNAFYSPNLYYSESLGALSESQFGTQVGFSPASPRHLQTVTVAMSSWTCQSGNWNDGTCLTTPSSTFNVPITFNVYNVAGGNAVGTQIATVTQTFAIPYRPSADPTCPATGSQTPIGAAFRDPAGNCQNGLVSEITFAFPGEALPDNVIFGIAYAPTGPAGSLNVMLYPSDANAPVATQPTVGTFPLPNDAYADHTSGTTFPFQFNAGGYGGTQPAVQFTAN